MNLKKLWKRGHQLGGIHLFFAYCRIGVGGVVLKQLLRVLFGRTSFDNAYNVIRWNVNKWLQFRYGDYIKERKGFYDGFELAPERSNKVWTCWLQGFDDSPELVKVCQESLIKHLSDREIIQLTYENYNNYVTLPEDIIRKYEKGKIPPALFSDLLRLEVLLKYGGTWMDATILCTGNHYSKEIFDCDLFMFQSLRKGDDRFYGTSNWFITSCSNNRLLLVLRDVLYQYWRDYSVTLNYYMFHDFFYAIAQLYPEEIATMPRKNRLLPLMLMQRMGDTYDEKWMAELMKRCCFHKLNYRISDAVKGDKDNFYHAIIGVKYRLMK